MCHEAAFLEVTNYLEQRDDEQLILSELVRIWITF